MKVVLFDLGDTLEHQDVLLPGAVETLTAISRIRDEEHQPVGMGLVSDFDVPRGPDEIPAIRRRYLAILDRLRIRAFFEPVDVGVTLSTEVGVHKPDPRVFRAALDKFGPGLPFQSALFVTENEGHVLAARSLGMRAVHLAPGPGASGDITTLPDLIPIVHGFASSPRPAATGPAPVQAVDGDDAHGWARFGDDVFPLDPPDRTGGTRDAGATRRREQEVPRDQLRLVIQCGRSFQKAHPDVPVLLDHGRFLVVAVDPSRRSALDDRTGTRFAVRPLADRQVVFTSSPSGRGRGAPLPWIQALVDRVSRASYEADLRHLVSYPTRHSTSGSYREAAAWVGRRLEDMGYGVRTQAITVDGGAGLNVVADRPGRRSGSRGLVVATAHLDSVNHDAGGGPDVPAPGADDNASGSAGVLQVAHALREHPAAEDLRLILFGGEEQGLLGSRHHVSGLGAAERARLRAVVNMDMIGCLNRTPASVLLEGAAVSQAVIDGLARAAATYTGLVVETSLSPWGSDHLPFIEEGLPAVLTIEGADQANENEHSGRDRIDTVSLDLALEILRMNVAFLAAELDTLP
ncbi:Haloacid dehalogenase-like hydrolase [Geodermatophilus saharensis]|uniref:Haloacid dehalogenase-like hydrolase n=1 Tax=Geodermatophilus saharensis TaxID=1137994 RepID=A0A239C1M1_9ACTN|nr:M20/M25/M40 family metallo-hydrolase [Geodermatophilus saharensis]SNS14137.1 Haloacid dehalogenase-like hydrolase [Geodermatophilus saharensis]